MSLLIGVQHRPAEFEIRIHGMQSSRQLDVARGVVFGKNELAVGLREPRSNKPNGDNLYEARRVGVGYVRIALLALEKLHRNVLRKLDCS